MGNLRKPPGWFGFHLFYFFTLIPSAKHIKSWIKSNLIASAPLGRLSPLWDQELKLNKKTLATRHQFVGVSIGSGRPRNILGSSDWELLRRPHLHPDR